MLRTTEELRAFAIEQSFFQATDLTTAFERLRFVQIDPIQMPARAQDLILRHRVSGYAVGDVDNWYRTGEIEEGVLYASGYLLRSDWELLHKVQDQRLTAVERRVLDLVNEQAEVTTRMIDNQLNRVRGKNDWGREASLASVTLESLYRRGLLRIAGRSNGLRVFSLAVLPENVLSGVERFKGLVLLVARTLGPLPEATLHRISARFRRRIPEVKDHRRIVVSLCQSGELVKETIDGIPYLWLASPQTKSNSESKTRFLTPFDPVVWDRDRFKQLWGWEYRFEAYTKPAKRVRGRYAMPLLFGNRMIGWANVSPVKKQVEIELGFIGGNPPSSGEFTASLDCEIANIRSFLLDKENEI